MSPHNVNTLLLSLSNELQQTEQIAINTAIAEDVTLQITYLQLQDTWNKLQHLTIKPDDGFESRILKRLNQQEIFN